MPFLGERKRGHRSILYQQQRNRLLRGRELLQGRESDLFGAFASHGEVPAEPSQETGHENVERRRVVIDQEESGRPVSSGRLLPVKGGGDVPPPCHVLRRSDS